MIGNFGCRPHGEKIGILLAQLGTPDEPTTAGLRRYLGQFLADPRVIEVNRVLWWLLLNGIILRTRPRRSAEAYRRIWTPEGSPLLVTSRAQAAGLQERLKVQFGDAAPVVTLGMRYGNPSLASALDELERAECTRVLVFPLYPQYAAATTGSTYDEVFRLLLKRRWVPTLSVVEPYYRHPAYLAALATSVSEGIAALPFEPELVLVSYHGVPVRYIRSGDPYCCMCTETTRLLKERLSFPADRIIQTFQSRFGREPWLTPYTDESVERCAEKGIERLAVVCPGFAADCLETIDEIGNEARHAFQEKGGKELALVPSVNAHPAWLDAMVTIVTESIAPWSSSRPSCSPCTKESCPASQRLITLGIADKE